MVESLAQCSAVIVHRMIRLYACVYNKNVGSSVTGMYFKMAMLKCITVHRLICASVYTINSGNSVVCKTAFFTMALLSGDTYWKEAKELRLMYFCANVIRELAVGGRG